MLTTTTFSGAAKRRVMAALMALMMVLSFLGLAAPAKAETSTSTATVVFIEGDLSLIPDPSGSKLNFDFGSHYLPSTQVSYPAENTNDHILSVEDGRVASGNWYVTVSLSNFAEAGGSSSVEAFAAEINLKNPDVYNANAATGTTGLTHVNDITVASEGDAQLVMEADDTLERGLYSMEWTNANVTLNIGNSQVSKIGLQAYAATVSWSLTQGPR